MDQETLWQQFSSLPREARHEVADFIAFLQAKYTRSALKEQAPGDIRNEPFVGIWHDRAEMSEAREWVRAVRKREWRDHYGEVQNG